MKKMSFRHKKNKKLRNNLHISDIFCIFAAYFVLERKSQAFLLWANGI